MLFCFIFRWLIVKSIAVALVASQGYYSVIAPGLIKSNHNYHVLVALHQAPQQATIRITLEGPSYRDSKTVYLQPFETSMLEFKAPKLSIDGGDHKLIAEGLSGIEFRNESVLHVNYYSGPKIYIQTDKGVYKPGDEVQLRVLLMDEHTRPLEVEEPIRIEISDGKGNRVKQFKDVSFVHGVFKGKFQLSSHPVMGSWKIDAYISGRYDYTQSKYITVQHYVLPKFSVYIEMDPNFVPADKVLKFLVYAKYTFDKYVEGNATAIVTERYSGAQLSEQQFYVKDKLDVEFYFNNPEKFKNFEELQLLVYFSEKQTGAVQNDKKYIAVRQQKYKIFVETDSIHYDNGKPYRLTATVQYWNGTKVSDRSSSVHMNHGSQNYEAYLNTNGEATFEFDHNALDNHIFHYKDSKYIFSNIYVDSNHKDKRTNLYCKLKILGDRPRLGEIVEIEVTSIDPIPYLVFAIIAHANIIEVHNVILEANQRSYVIRITPSIVMIPVSFVYVHYVKNGNFHYGEIELRFPLEFENKISVEAPKRVNPGQEVTLSLRAQPGSYVGVLAVDLGVYLLNPSYDLKRDKIMNDLLYDRTYLPIAVLLYPGMLAGVVTLTNAHYEFKSYKGDGSVAGDSAGPLKFRRKFPETWIFENYEISEDITQLTLPIPDTITTWRITAFSMHDFIGFGIVDGPTDITSVQTFFINLNLPYSVKRGEIVAIPVLVYNYHTQPLNTEVKFYNTNREFDFMTSNIFAGFRVTHSNYQSQRIDVPVNGVKTVKFYITPKHVGELNLTIVAVNTFASDAIIQQLRVEPEGVAQHHNTPLYIGVQEGENFRKTLTFSIPANKVPRSEYITLSVGGSVLVPALKNLNGLVLLPTGCGEQNMINFAPNILVLQYLRSSGYYLKEKDVANKAKKYIEIGYQQQLSYRHENGGYSVFGQGQSKETGTWLTAYVIRYFLKAQRYLSIEGHIIESGLEYLSKNQAMDGSFFFTGYLFYPAQQNTYGFTAFVLMTFLEQRKYALRYRKTVEIGLQFLTNNIDNVEDIYALSIMAATLQMAKHKRAKNVLDKLKSRQKQTTDTIWWTQADGNLEKDVEITAYILMAMLDADGHNLNEVSRIFKWLTEQRNERGGFKSTHDTVVGMQALVKYAEKYTNLTDNRVKFKFTAKNPDSRVMKTGEWTVDKNNIMILNTEELPISTRSVHIEASGSGNSLLQLSYSYHVLNNETYKHFYVHTVPSMVNADELYLDICFQYPQANNKANEGTATNMIIMEVNLPSGFTSNDEFDKELLDIEIIERVESKNDETVLVIYFEKLKANVQNCFDIYAVKMHEVPQRQPVSISIYDYYNISRHDTIFYSI